MSETTTTRDEPRVLDLTNMSRKELRRTLLAIQAERELINLEASSLNLEGLVNKKRFAGRTIQDGVLLLDSTVTEPLVDFLTEKIDAYVQAYSEDEVKPGLTLVINSPGGSVFEGWRLFDELRAASLAGHQIITKVRGMAASMAAVIVQAGDTRIVGPESYLMIHEPSTWAGGKAFEIKDQAKFIDMLNDQMAKKFVERSGVKTLRQMKALFEKTDAWFNAEECIKHGFADVIG